MKGEVGDRTVVLKDKGDSFPATPTIEIYKTEGDDVVSVVDKIRFMTGFADLQ